jgi:hypothetical protein
MKYQFLLILLTFSLNSMASFPDFFGSGQQNSAIGGQATLNSDNPANNYYIPAILAYSKRVALNYTINAVSHNLNEINNIVIENNTNGDSTEYGNANNSYDDYYNNVVHMTIPIKKINGTVGISVYAPAGYFMESSTGHPTSPEYVMYRSRYKRTMMNANYAHALTQKLSLSLGLLMGLQVTTEAYTQASLNGTGYGSSGYMKTKVKPALGAIFSALYRFKDHGHIYFTFQQEMKNKFAADMYGENSIPAPTPFHITMNSMVYYDPYIFRLGAAQRIGNWELMGSLEYQMWGQYKTPVMKINKEGGIIESSDNYEQVRTQDIIIPKLGLTWRYSDDFSLSLGHQYRPTPLKGDFSNSGNSLDTNVAIYSAGASWKSHLGRLDESISLEFGPTFQYHALTEKRVEKTTGQENGSAGSKIGAPGYTIGGKVIMVGIGANILF